MHALMRLLSDVLHSLGDGANRHFERDSVLKPIVLIAIALVAGPEIITFVEMSALLELLGAVMFLVAFSSGFKLIGIAFYQRLAAIVVPDGCSSLLSLRSPTAAGIVAVVCMERWLLYFVLCALPYMLIQEAIFSMSL